MTDRDPTPHAPTCPLCGSHERVQREKDRWLCGECWTVFTGGPDEWARSRELRERRANAYGWIAQRAEREATSS